MAIDTADKRASAFGWPGTVFPTPDGSLALAADRLHVAGLYRGIAAVAITALDATDAEIVATFRMGATATFRGHVVAGFRMELVGG